MPKSVENGQQRIIVPAYRIYICGVSATENYRIRYNAQAVNIGSAIDYALDSFQRSYPASRIIAVTAKPSKI